MSDGMPAVRTIRSASDHGEAPSGDPDTKPFQNRSTRAFEGPAAQATRDRIEQSTNGPAWRSGGRGEPADRSAQGVPGNTAPTCTAAMGLGTLMTTGYGAAYSEIVNHMCRAVERQSKMLNDMAHARGPGDVFEAGNQYLLGGLQAFFDTSARIARTSARTSADTTDNADPKPFERAV